MSSQVQSVAVTLQNGSSLTPSLPGVVAGHLLMLTNKWFQTLQLAPAAPTHCLTAESPAGLQFVAGQFIHAEINYRENAPGGTNAPVISYNAGAYADVVLAEYALTGT